MLPKISSYGNYDNSNYGAHTLRVCLGNMTIYYSYETIVAYDDNQDGLVCSENQWSTTTGKHLNWIQPDKKARINGETFGAMLTEALKRHII
jgi:hypothetical protein